MNTANLRPTLGAAWLLGVLLAVFFYAAPAGAQVNYTVTTLNDAITNDGQCSLREAIQEANNGADTDCTGSPSNGNDTITFSVSGTITLSSRLPNIQDAATVGTLTIDGDVNGDGIGDITISGNNTLGVLSVDSGGNLTLQNLTIANGNDSGSGGGIFNRGTLTITNCTFSNNSAGASGGAILSGNALNVVLNVARSTFSNNRASGAGGAIEISCCGVANVTDSVFSGNEAGTDGGAIDNLSSILNVSGSTFSSNRASNIGGAIANATGRTANVTSSTFNNNTANSFGGGISNSGTLTVSGSTFAGNNSNANGGAIDNNGALTVVNSTFSSNSARNNGGGIYTDIGSTLTVTNSTFSGNAAPSGGGIYNAAPATVKNTIVANSTGANCMGGAFAAASTNNLDTDGTCSPGFTTITSAQLNLGPLTGSPAYFPLVFPSAAIDAGDPTTCSNAPVSNQSQNGVTRPQDGDANGSAICDIGSFEATAPVADMSAWVASGAVGAGQTVTGWVFECANGGPDPAINATCSISASAGTISNVTCSPAVPVASLASGASITCTFDFTAPGTQGGGDTPETSVIFTATAGANNDSNGFNDVKDNTATLVDALNDSAAFPANTTQSYNVRSNDQYGTDSLPGTATFTLQGGTTCPFASMSSSGVATFTVPLSGSCAVVYRVCVGTACDTAQLTVTAQQQEPIPTLDEWGLAALVLLMVGAGLLLVRRVVA